MASPIEKAKELIAKGEKLEALERAAKGAPTGEEVLALLAFDAARDCADLLPILRLLVECEHWIDGVCELIETSDFAPTGEPRLVEEAQRGRALLKRIRGEA